MVEERISFDEFLKIYSKVPRLCVDLIIKNDQGILLTKRSIEPAKGMWHFPGGTLIKNETLDEAVKRVAKRELNLHINDFKQIGFIEFFTREEKYPPHSVSLVFLINSFSGDLILNNEANDYTFVKEIIPNLLEEHKNFIKSNEEKIFK